MHALQRSSIGRLCVLLRLRIINIYPEWNRHRNRCADILLTFQRNNDSGRNLLDQVVIPAGSLQTNQSYARVSDAAEKWEVKDGSAEKYVTPSTNNKTIDSNAKMEKFEEHDSVGIGMSISAMSVVFFGLILLYVSFKVVGRVSVNLSKRNAMKAKGITDKQEAKEKKLGEAPGEIFAAIAMAMHEMQSDVHDVEDTVLTITRVKRSYSPWSSKIYTLRETPLKK